MRIMYACVLLSALSGGALAQSPPQLSKLALSASEFVNVEPDQATLNLGVVNQGKNAATALTANSDAMQKVIEALKAAGIASKNIQSSRLSLQPQYTYKEGMAPLLNGYQAQNTITVTIDDLAKTGSVLDKVTELGINSVEGPHFQIKDSNKAENEARQKAMESLKTRAQLYANGMGVKLGRILNLSESTSSPQPMMNYAVVESMAPRSKSVPVEAGELRVNAQVTAEWEILP